MNVRTVAALVLLMACATAIPAPRRIVVAEGRQHVLALYSVTTASSKAADWYATAMQTDVPAVRQAPGNVAVYVLRRDTNGVSTLTLASEWSSHRDLEACRRSGTCRRFVDEEEILFEALR